MATTAAISATLFTATSGDDSMQVSLHAGTDSLFVHTYPKADCSAPSSLSAVHQYHLSDGTLTIVPLETPTPCGHPLDAVSQIATSHLFLGSKLSTTPFTPPSRSLTYLKDGTLCSMVFEQSVSHLQLNPSRNLVLNQSPAGIEIRSISSPNSTMWSEKMTPKRVEWLTDTAFLVVQGGRYTVYEYADGSIEPVCDREVSAEASLQYVSSARAFYSISDLPCAGEEGATLLPVDPNSGCIAALYQNGDKTVCQLYKVEGESDTATLLKSWEMPKLDLSRPNDSQLSLYQMESGRWLLCSLENSTDADHRVSKLARVHLLDPTKSTTETLACPLVEAAYNHEITSHRIDARTVVVYTQFNEENSLWHCWRVSVEKGGE